MESLRRTYFLGLALCFFLTLQAQIESHLTYRRYITQDGLPQMQTERLWQDSRGYIYIGTLSGFVRYDGRTFTPFLKGRRINIVGFTEVDNEVRALGFFRQWTVGFDDIESHPLDPNNHWLLNNLNAGSLPNGYALLEDSLEQHRRLCRMTKQGFEPILTDTLLDEMTPDRKLYLDSKTKEVIVPTEKGIYQFVKKTKKNVKLSDRNDIYTLFRTETALLGFAPDGIYSFDTDSLKCIVKADWGASSYGLIVRALRSGHLIIADEHTVYLFDGKAVSQIVSGINLIRDVLVDRWDRLWVATYQGVYCFFNRCFTNHHLSDENDIVRAVVTDQRGRLVMGTLNGKVLVQDSTVVIVSDDSEQYYAPSGVRIDKKVYLAGNGDVACIDTEDETLHWLGLPRNRYQFVGEAWGQLIVGSRNMIMTYDPKTSAVDTLTTNILHPWCSAQDKDGLLWIGSSSGLFNIDKTRKVCKKEYPNQKLIISAMEGDQQGNIYFASADSVFVIRKGQVESLNPQMPQLSGHEVRSLHISPKGYLVVAVVDGLFVCAVNNECMPVRILFFNHQNGFTMTEPLKTMMVETSDGTVWLPGVEQMTSFRPADLLAYSEEETFIAPPLRWWQHWWVWITALALLIALVWLSTRWYEKLRNRRRMIRLQSEKMLKEQQIEAIRQKAIAADNNELARDIVKMTDKSQDERITFRTASGIIAVNVADIAYFKGDGNYSQIVTFRDKDTVLIGLGALEKMLNPDVFVRADRSTLVNIHHISNLLPKQRRCIFCSPEGIKLETTLLAPAFKRLQVLLQV